MTRPEDETAQAKKLAQNMQQELDAFVQDERDTEALMERLDKLAVDLRDLALAWDDVDADMAARVRAQEQEVHELRGRVERLGEAEAAEATKIIAAIRNQLRKVHGGA